MTREQKLALVLGFAAVLVVGLLISDHLAAARSSELEDAPHDATVLVDASEGQALRRVVTLPETERLYRGRPYTQLARQEPALTTGEAMASDTPQASDAIVASLPEDLPIASSTPEEPIRLVLGSGGGVLDPARPQRTDTVLDRVGDTVASGAEALANGVRRFTGLATGTPITGMAQLDGQPVSRAASLAPVVVQHHIQPGESLYKIAAKYYGDGNQWRRIAKDNTDRVGDDGAVRVGVTLRILDPKLGAAPDQAVARTPIKIDPQAKPVTQDPKPAARPAQAQGAMTYTVRPGDTLGEISQKLLGTVRRQHELIALNRDVLKDPDHLRAGMVLKLPSS